MESFNPHPPEPGKGARPSSESVPVGEERRQTQLAPQNNQILAAIASAFVQNSTQEQQSQMAAIGLGALVKSAIEGAAQLQQVQALQRMQNPILPGVQFTQLSAASQGPQGPTGAAVTSLGNTPAATEVTTAQYSTGDAPTSHQATELSGKVKTDEIDTASTAGVTIIPGLVPQPPEGCTIARCKARGMPPGHNLQTAYFVIPEDIRHGQGLLCSYPDCRIAGCKFCFCIYCRLPVAKGNFNKRHNHGEFASNKDEENSLEDQPFAVAEGKNYASRADRRQPAVGRLKQDGSRNTRSCQSTTSAIAVSASTSSREGSASGSSDLAAVQSEFPPDVVAKTTPEIRSRWAALLGSCPPNTNDKEVRHWLAEVLAASALVPELPRAQWLSTSNISLISSTLEDCKRDQDGFSSSAAGVANPAHSDSSKDRTRSSTSEEQRYLVTLKKSAAENTSSDSDSSYPRSSSASSYSDMIEHCQEGRSERSTLSDQGTTSSAAPSSKASYEKKMRSSRRHRERILRRGTKRTRRCLEEDTSDPENQLEAESTGDSSQINNSCGRKRRLHSYSSSDEYSSDFSHRGQVRRSGAYESRRGHSSDD